MLTCHITQTLGVNDTGQHYWAHKRTEENVIYLWVGEREEHDACGHYHVLTASLNSCCTADLMTLRRDMSFLSSDGIFEKML